MLDVCIGLLGCGTVGSGVIELTRRRAQKITDMTGMHPIITRVLVKDLHKARSVSFTQEKITDNPQEILGDPNIGLIIETIGGIEPAKELILSALRAGKHVVTANKDLIALYGPEILAVAEAAGADVFYEAAVGGAIPLIRPLKESLTANHITDLKGIINGTTNYILSRMTETGADFEDALREAQALGYAESNPASDLDGLDAARKLTILASIAFQSRVRLDDVDIRGIRSVTAKDVAYAHDLGAVVKLLAVGVERDNKLALSVRPTMVPKNHPLAHVSDSFNALFVRGDAAGDLMFFGRGAGSLPTASAVVGDVIEALRNMRIGVSGRVRHGYLEDRPVELAIGEAMSHYMRMSVMDKPGVFSRIAGIFGEANVSMETVLQKRAERGGAEIVIVTHEVTSQQVSEVLRALSTIPSVRAVHCVMPVEKITE